MIITIRVQPASSKNEIVSKEGNVWKVKLTAAPVDGKANKSLITLLSKELKIAKSLITITKGATSKIKTVQVDV